MQVAPTFLPQIVDKLEEFSGGRSESVDDIYLTPLRFAPAGEDSLIRSIWSFKNRHFIKT